MHHGVVGLPSTRTRTGIGLRQSGLSRFARAALTGTYGLMPLMPILARKRSVAIARSELQIERRAEVIDHRREALVRRDHGRQQLRRAGDVLAELRAGGKVLAFQIFDQ